MVTKGRGDMELSWLETVRRHLTFFYSRLNFVIYLFIINMTIY